MPVAGDEPFMTVRDAVMEMRGDLKALRAQVDRIEREGSFGTKSELIDHESRMRSLEKWKYGIPLSAVASICAFVTSFIWHPNIPH
jgi:hypothetical protein